MPKTREEVLAQARDAGWYAFPESNYPRHGNARLLVHPGVPNRIELMLKAESIYSYELETDIPFDHAALILKLPRTKEGSALALEFIAQYGGIDGAHHKQWVLDQVVRALTKCPIVETASKKHAGLRHWEQGENSAYKQWVADHEQPDEDGETEHPWDTGVAP